MRVEVRLYKLCSEIKYDLNNSIELKFNTKIEDLGDTTCILKPLKYVLYHFKTAPLSINHHHVPKYGMLQILFPSYNYKLSAWITT